MTLENQLGAKDPVRVESVLSRMRSGRSEGGQLRLAGEVLMPAFQRYVADGVGR